MFEFEISVRVVRVRRRVSFVSRFRRAVFVFICVCVNMVVIVVVCGVVIIGMLMCCLCVLFVLFVCVLCVCDFVGDFRLIVVILCVGVL